MNPVENPSRRDFRRAAYCLASIGLLFVVACGGPRSTTAGPSVVNSSRSGGPTVSSGRPSIRGRVVTPDGRGIPEVTVSTKPPTDVVLTLADGTFDIGRVLQRGQVSDLPAGEYELHFKKLGYEPPKKLPIASVQQGPAAVGDIEMREEGGPEPKPIGPVDADSNIREGTQGVVRDGD